MDSLLFTAKKTTLSFQRRLLWANIWCGGLSRIIDLPDNQIVNNKITKYVKQEGVVVFLLFVVVSLLVHYLPHLLFSHIY